MSKIVDLLPSAGFVHNQERAPDQWVGHFLRALAVMGHDIEILVVRHADSQDLDERACDD